MKDDEHIFKYSVGTLIEDLGKLAIITRVLASGALKTLLSGGIIMRFLTMTEIFK